MNCQHDSCQTLYDHGYSYENFTTYSSLLIVNSSTSDDKNSPE